MPSVKKATNPVSYRPHAHPVFRLAPFCQTRQDFSSGTVPSSDFLAGSGVILCIEFFHQCGFAERTCPDVVGQTDIGVELMLIQWDMDALPDGVGVFFCA